MGVTFTHEQLAQKGIDEDGNFIKTVKQKPVYSVKEPVITFPGIFIPGEVPSSKNQKEAKVHSKEEFDEQEGKMKKKTFGKVHLSKFTKEYKAESGKYYLSYKQSFLSLVDDLPLPYHIGFLVYRKSVRAFDYGNIIQIVQDQMQNYEWIPEDNMQSLVPHYLGWKKIPSTPGVWIIPYQFHP